MATVYKKTYTKPLPPTAEVFSRKAEQLARWKDTKGRTRIAKVTIPQSGKHAGTMRISVEGATYTAKYRTGAGHVVERATGCRSKDGALSVLKQLTDRAEKVRAGVLSAAEDATADYQLVPLADHFDAYEDYLRASGRSRAIRNSLPSSDSASARRRRRGSLFSSACGTASNGLVVSRSVSTHQLQNVTAAIRQALRDRADAPASACRTSQRSSAERCKSDSLVMEHSRSSRRK